MSDLGTGSASRMMEISLDSWLYMAATRTRIMAERSCAKPAPQVGVSPSLTFVLKMFKCLNSIKYNCRTLATILTQSKMDANCGC